MSSESSAQIPPTIDETESIKDPEQQTGAESGEDRTGNTEAGSPNTSTNESQANPASDISEGKPGSTPKNNQHTKGAGAKTKKGKHNNMESNENLSTSTTSLNSGAPEDRSSSSPSGAAGSQRLPEHYLPVVFDSNRLQLELDSSLRPAFVISLNTINDIGLVNWLPELIMSCNHDMFRILCYSGPEFGPLNKFLIALYNPVDGTFKPIKHSKKQDANQAKIELFKFISTMRYGINGTRGDSQAQIPDVFWIYLVAIILALVALLFFGSG